MSTERQRIGPSGPVGAADKERNHQPATLGILGAGQLAAMLTEAANRIGIDVHVVQPSASTDRATGNHLTTTALTDFEALRAFAADVDVVTVETENIPVDTLRFLEGLVAVRPSAAVVEVVQDRLLEKQSLADAGIPTAQFFNVESEDEFRNAAGELGGPGILKTRRFGYDGKGQIRVPSDAEGIESAIATWQDQGAPGCILEKLVPFDFEISVVAARSVSGDVASFDPGRNEHRDGILRVTEVPARISAEVEANARDIARRILESHDYVGVMGVEFFVIDGQLLVNELAPRVHNTGHWTQQGCATDQFEQHVRAVMGLPLGSTTRHNDVVMTNIIGNDLDSLDELLLAEHTRVHLYGKREVRPGRKMGHSNQVFPCGSRS